MNNKNPNVILIGGTGRSGTNITKKILEQNTHTISLPFEYRFTLDPDGIIDFYNSFPLTWSPYIVDKKIKRLEIYLLSLARKNFFPHLTGELIQRIDKTGKRITPDCYHGWELNKWFPNYEFHVKKLISNLKSFEYSACWPGADKFTIHNNMYFSTYKDKNILTEIIGNFLNNLINDLLQKSKKEYFIEDNTWNILFAQELFDLLPEAKLIHVVRDPRDVVASMKQQRWTPTDTKKIVTYYLEIMHRWMKIKKKLPQDRYIEIKLEEITSDVKNTVENICTFTHLPFEKEMISLNLSKSHTGRWKKDFSQNEQSYVEKRLTSILKQFDYQ